MFKKIKEVIINQIKQGATPKGLSASIATACILGTSPVLGSSTALCLVVGQIFKLNQPLMQAANYLLYPLQIVLIPVYIYIGESILGEPHITLNPVKVLAEFNGDWGTFFKEYGMAGVHGLLAYVIIAPFAGYLLYLLIRPLLEKFAVKYLK